MPDFPRDPLRMGMPELLIALVIFMLIFGVGKLPQVGKALGQSIREFREGTQGLGEEDASKEADV